MEEDSSIITVPSNIVGRIIGKGGSKIRELQDDSGANINVNRDSHGNSTTVEITGHPDAINKATELINELINDGSDRGSRSFGRSQQRDNAESFTMNVPSSIVGRIIGRGGSKIRELQDDSGAKIDVKRDSHGNSTPVEITGPPDAINRATELINELINDGSDRGSRSFGGSSFSNSYGEPGSTFGQRRNESNRGFGRSQQGDNAESFTMNVPSSSVGRIIGKGGSKIRELQGDSGANINVKRDSQGESTPVEITGPQEAINRATEMINELIND